MEQQTAPSPEGISACPQSWQWQLVAREPALDKEETAQNQWQLDARVPALCKEETTQSYESIMVNHGRSEQRCIEMLHQNFAGSMGLPRTHAGKRHPAWAGA
eukprot:820085-Pelagomonas_calceolata.AAC.2